MTPQANTPYAPMGRYNFSSIPQTVT